MVSSLPGGNDEARDPWVAVLRDEASIERDRAGERRDGAARSRDMAASARDRAGDERDAVGDQRDRAASQRDDIGERRDEAGAVRDRVAEQRDHAADGRDRAELKALRTGDPAEALTRLARARVSASSDRRRAAQDRLAGASERIAAERDRDAGASDRLAAEHDRDAGASERTEATHDREAALADRAAGARQRAASVLDRSRAAEDRLALRQRRQHSPFDDLTGAYRAQAGFVELEREIARARRTGEPLTLTSVNIDAVDDAEVRNGGDERLAGVAGAITAMLRPYDVIVRAEDETFVCAASGLDRPAATKRFARVRTAVADGPGHPHVAAGVAELEPGDSLEDLLDRAGAALSQERGHEA